MLHKMPPRPGLASTDRVAVVIPCLNEEATVADVVADFRKVLANARIVVVDNNSTDQTSTRALEAGAEVYIESRKGKGFALQRGFAEVRDADYVVIVDGDRTYPAEEVTKLLEAARNGADMVIGTRLENYDSGAYRLGHTFGNRVFILLVRVLFGVKTRDLFSGYRVLNRRFLDQSPLIARGFEIETELSLQALAGGFSVAELPIHYKQRQDNSSSKLRTLPDGYRILIALLAFFRDYRPLTFFGIVGLCFFAASLACSGVVVAEYLRTGTVLRIPLAILSIGLIMLCAMSLIAGIIISSINRRAGELTALIGRR
jgi:glycosyltransferase involved in cell wall biosynthesis